MQRAGAAASKIIFAAALSVLGACSSARPDIIQVGPWFAPRAVSEVKVFSSREETTAPWGAIAVIHSPKFPQNNKSAVVKTGERIIKMAAEIGADGVIMTTETEGGGSQLAVYQAPEVYLSALAFKYAANVSTTTEK